MQEEEKCLEEEEKEKRDHGAKEAVRHIPNCAQLAVSKVIPI